MTIPLLDLAGVDEAEPRVERVRRVLARVVAELHLSDAVLPCFLDQQLECAVAVPLALVTGVDHEAPHPELVRRVAVRHDESHGLVVGIDGAKP